MTLRQLIAALKPPNDGCGQTLTAELFAQPAAERDLIDAVLLKGQKP